MKKHFYKNKKFPQFLFHPFEVGFCGFSNSGKTTLISRLVKDLKNYKVGYTKHDVHYFEMDKPGKDTFTIRESGAHRVAINSEEESALLGDKLSHQIDYSQQLLDLDFVFIEGYKDSPIPKIIVIDDQKEILQEIKNDRFHNVIAFTGKESHYDQLPVNIPYFQIDNIEAIRQFILQYINQKIKEMPLYGLVLVGGKSTRMGTDKAMLNYHGQSQLEHSVKLLSPFVERVFVSSRAGQIDDNIKVDQIHDVFLEQGPAGGMLSAMAFDPKAAWFVIACDLPFLDESTIKTLIAQRNALKFATCYNSSTDYLPEPLCAIYEPKARMRLMQFMSYGMTCPRKFLINSEVCYLELENKNSLDNINHFNDYKKVVKEFEHKGEHV